MIYPIGRYTIRPFMFLWVRKISGMNNLKKDFPYIVACNHASFFDDLIVPSIVAPTKNKYLHIYVNSRFFRNFFLRQFLEWGRSIPVDVSKGENSKERNRRAFESALKYLRKGELVGIFPEGHRSRDGRLQKAKLGAAKLALKSRVPVIPIGIIGSYEILPRGKAFPRFKRCSINIGKPMFFDRYYGKENNKKVLVEVTNKIMKEIAKLSNQQYNV